MKHFFYMCIVQEGQHIQFLMTSFESCKLSLQPNSVLSRLLPGGALT